ncbi:peptidylprolyl isomerase SurA [Veronia pacifica]|uniref:Chaperone SurA n=1 Tax=Veronia pacifica TaxID=1080227 RepID=A0A1C3EPZ5_9GAMM|nr:peptidylprolyl isomerase SurA [Veronia pacifica]ODA35323.1 peptidylprolyl isomerase SurA [Veronia pacifica]
MKKWTQITAALLLALSAAPSFAVPSELDRVVTVVNEDVILRSDIDIMRKLVIFRADGSTDKLPSEEILNAQILNDLIDEKLQLQQAERLGIRVGDIRLDQAITRIAKEDGLTVQQLRKKLIDYRLSWADYREEIRQQMAASEARTAQVRRRINILPQEIDALSTALNAREQQNIQYKFSHIQLPLKEAATAEEKNKTAYLVRAIEKKLKEGADFSSMALAYSKGRRALEGGDWGWLRLEEMPTLFADQIANHKKGEIIGPFRSGVGFHFIKIDDVKGQKTVAVTEFKARHILIKPSVILSDTGAKKQLMDLMRDVRTGKRSFADIAQEYSEDTGSSANGGLLDWQTSDTYTSDFKEQLEQLKVGQISEPFKTIYGWHVIKLIDKRIADRTDDAAKNRAANILFRRKFNDEVQAWLQELRAAAYIENINEQSDER